MGDDDSVPFAFEVEDNVVNVDMAFDAAALALLTASMSERRGRTVVAVVVLSVTVDDEEIDTLVCGVG